MEGIENQAIIASLRDAESILILGSGEAKGELQQRLETCNLGGGIVSVETVDKITDRQIAAKVRKRYLEQPWIPVWFHLFFCGGFPRAGGLTCQATIFI